MLPLLMMLFRFELLPPRAAAFDMLPRHAVTRFHYFAYAADIRRLMRRALRCCRFLRCCYLPVDDTMITMMRR